MVSARHVVPASCGVAASSAALQPALAIITASAIAAMPTVMS